MVSVRGTAHVPALESKLAAEARNKFGAQAANAPLLNQKGKSALGARLARAMIAVNLDQFHDDGGRLEQFDKNIQRRSDGKSSGAHLSADQNVEAEPARLFRWNERDILRLTVRAVVHATSHGDVEFSRQVGEFRVALVADDDAIQFVDDRRSIEQFVRRQACQSATVDVANVVYTRLQRAQVHASQFFEDFRHGVESETAQLDLLPSSDVQNAIAKPSGELGDGAQLFTLRKAIGHANAHHEFAGRRFAEEYADPFQQFLFRRRERCRTSLDDLRQVIKDAQAVAVHRGFVAFDGVCADRDLRGIFAFHRGGNTVGVVIHVRPRGAGGKFGLMPPTGEISLEDSRQRRP